MHGSPTARTHQQARVETIVHALRGPRVLTRQRLAAEVGAHGWPAGSFSACLAHAVAEGRVNRLTDELYEVAEREKILGSRSA